MGFVTWWSGQTTWPNLCAWWMLSPIPGGAISFVSRTSRSWLSSFNGFRNVPSFWSLTVHLWGKQSAQWLTGHGALCLVIGFLRLSCILLYDGGWLHCSARGPARRDGAERPVCLLVWTVIFPSRNSLAIQSVSSAVPPYLADAQESSARSWCDPGHGTMLLVPWGHLQCESKKISPYGFLKFFPKRLGIFNQFFTHLLYDHFYTREQIFIQISPTLIKLCYTKRDHLAKFYISLEL